MSEALTAAPTSLAPALAVGAGQDGTGLARVRELLPSILHRHYFNAGRHGPIPRGVHAAIAAEAAIELEEGRGSSEGRRIEQALGAVRRRVEELLGAPEGSVALTHNATEGVNIAVTSIDWAFGDEVVTFTTEHPSALAPLEAAARRHGVVVRRIEPATAPEAVLEQVTAALTARTRMVMISHVSWATGAVVPLREIGDACHERGVVLVGDGAQTAGCIPLDVAALGVDFYAIPGQKWLCGPSGVGALYVRPELIETSHPGIVGWASLDDLDPVTGACAWLPDARRFEGASESVPLRMGFGEALRWLGDDLGFDWVHARITAGVARCRELLAEIPGVRVLTPADAQAGVVCFTVDGVEPDSVVFSLMRRRVVVRTVLHPECVRACVGFYNDDGDLQALRDAVAAVARRGTSAGAED